MLKNLAATLLLTLPAASLAMAQDAGSSAELTTAKAMQSETAKKSMDLRQSMQLVQEARNAYSAGRYTQAVDLYKEALKLVPVAESTAQSLDFIKMSLADALVAKAIDYREVGRAEEAISFLEEAVKLAPKHKLAAHELAKTQDPIRNNPALSPQNVANVSEVNRLLTLAYGSYDLGNYNEAIQHFNSVLAIDAYNTAAQRGIEKVNTRIASFSVAARDKVRAKSLEDVDRAFTDAASLSSLETALDLSEKAPINHASPAEIEASDYLASIPVDNISFEDAPLTEVMETLQGLLRRAAATKPVPNGQSINIISHFGKAGTPAYDEAMKKTLRLSLSNISFRDLLDMVTQQLGISYYYVPAGIEFTYSGKDFGPLIDRTFTVPPHFFATAADLKEEDAFAEDFGDSGSSVKVNRVNPIEQLKGMGISFPEGATARYLASSRTLHVRNTAYNMELLEEAMQYAPDGEKLVVLNVYVMSVSKDILDELGFDVLLNLNLGGDMNLDGGTAQAASNATGAPMIEGIDASTAPYISNGLRSGGEVFTENNMDRLISSGKVSTYSNQQVQKSPSFFGFRGIWSVADLTVLMRGLNQKKDVDILQNPQLIFRPGIEEQVSIASVKEMYYPESYEAPELSTTSMSVWNDTLNLPDIIPDDLNDLLDPTLYPNIIWYLLPGAILDLNDVGLDALLDFGFFAGWEDVNATIATPAHPDEFTYVGITEDQFNGIGTLLQVHSAEVTDGGRYVNLALSTCVNEFEGFIDWGSPIYAGMPSENEIGYLQLTDNKILKPIFKRSYENTAVTVSPGSVLVLGGLQESKKIRFEDKVPIIGDLPFVGRLFRSEGEEQETKVLLIFAKVNIVDPAGIDTQTGMHPEASATN